MTEIRFLSSFGDWREYPLTTLAWIGDGVYDLAMRLKLAGDSHASSGKLHSVATKLVSAKAQATLLESIYDKLCDKEQEVVRRGRNHNTQSMSKHADPHAYRDATALEVLLGYFAMTGKQERIDWLIEQGWEVLKHEI